MSPTASPSIRLSTAWLHYRPGYEVFTATSGRLRGLRSVFLTLDYGNVVATSEIRTNIAYLTGQPEETLERRIADGLRGLALSADPAGDRARIDALLPAAPTGLRLLVETALADAAARRAGQSVAALIGPGDPPLRAPTNQTLFLISDAALVERADAYVARGFRTLKLRMGAGDPAADLARARLLRDRFGAAVTLSCDANGAWDRAVARRMADALAELGFDYIEQPLAAGDLDGLAALARETPMRIMLDESVPDLPAIRTAVGLRAGLAVHLKLAKLGGLDRLAEAVRIAEAAETPVMIGQMNEGALATAATLAAAAALRPRWGELYGADNLVDDPFDGIVYADGGVAVSGRLGFGVEPSAAFDPGSAP